MSKISFARSSRKAELQVFAAPASFYAKGWLQKVAEGAWVADLQKAAKKLQVGTDAASVTTLTELGSAVAIVLPKDISRHNTPSAADALAIALRGAGIAGKKAAVTVGVADKEHVLPSANAVGRMLPLFTRKKGKKKAEGSTTIAFSDAGGRYLAASTEAKETVEAARWAAMTVDTHPAEMTTAIFAREAKKLVKGLKSVKVTEIVGGKLLEQKLAGIHAVGRTAKVAPRLLLLDYKPAKATKCYALVGKGVIYDTGGLSLKSGPNMGGMKGDMGGAAAVTGAFRALAASGFKERVVCAVPLAENAIGPDSYRNDDILTMHSGKTVEINNTDAEGRILLADAVSYVGRKIKPDLIVDAATLTGAQLIATGHRHAGIVSNRAALEEHAVRTGRSSGDLTHALPFAPEFYQSEFASKVADMKNSVADRGNAQSSCAGQFIYSHIDDLDLGWLHVDLAGPAFRDGRGTGYGVALMAELLREMKPADLK